MASNRSYKQRLSVQGSTLTLADLRWLVEKTKDWQDSSRINVTHYDSQRDGANSTIEVVGDEKV